MTVQRRDDIGDRSLTLKVEVEAHQRPVVDATLARSLWFVPRWIRTIIVKMQDSDDSHQTLATATCSNQYRLATIAISPAWFTLDPRERLQTFMHEISHFHMSRTILEIDRLVDLLKDVMPGAAATYIDRRYTEALEADAEDLGYLLLEIQDRTAESLNVPIQSSITDIAAKGGTA